MSVEFRNNSTAVKAQMEANIKRALTAMGIEAVAMTVDNIKGNKYGNPIVKSGTLRDSIEKEVNLNDETVTIGSRTEYAPMVHEGTGRMAGRPFLKDAILENKETLRDVAARELEKGF